MKSTFFFAFFAFCNFFPPFILVIEIIDLILVQLQLSRSQEFFWEISLEQMDPRIYPKLQLSSFSKNSPFKKITQGVQAEVQGFNFYGWNEVLGVVDVIGGSCGEKKISSRLEKNHGLFFRPHKVWGPKCRYFSMAKKLGVAEGVCCHLIIFSSCFLSLSTLLRWLVGRPQTCGPVAQAHHVWSAVHQWEGDIHETVLIRNGLPDDHVHFALRLSSFLWRLWCWNLKRQDLLGPFHHFVWSFHEELDD